MRMNLSTAYVIYNHKSNFEIYNACVSYDYDIDYYTTFNYNLQVDCIFWFNI